MHKLLKVIWKYNNKNPHFIFFGDIHHKPTENSCESGVLKELSSSAIPQLDL